MSKKQIKTLNGYQKTERLEQIRKNEEEKAKLKSVTNETYEKKLGERADLWYSDVVAFEDRVYNIEMSPRQLMNYWQNKDSKAQVKKGVGYIFPISPTIKNSEGNRDPNYRDLSTRLDKIEYNLTSIVYARDYNILPVSMIINQDGQKQFNWLLAKDRGTFNFYCTKLDTKQSLKFWNKMVERLKKDEYKTKDKVKRLRKNIEHLISQGSEFSAREAVPTDLFETWLDDTSYINVRVKLETFTSHKNEMRRYNNTTNEWVEHNHIRNDIIIPLCVEYPELYKESTLNRIYSVSCKHNLFMGEDFLNVLNPKIESYEEFIPWLYSALQFKYKKDLNKKLQIIARGGDVNYNRKKVAYGELFENECSFVKNKKLEDTTKVFENNISKLVKISENSSLRKFIQKHKKVITDLKSNKVDVISNLGDLKLSKYDTFLTTAFCIDDIYNKVHKNFSLEKLNEITTTFFNIAIDKLEEDDLFDNLKSKNGGLISRYELFWNDVMLKTLSKKLAQKNNKFDSDDLLNISIDLLDKEGHSKNKFVIYDRVSSTEVRELLIDWDNHQLEKGKIIPTEEYWYGNVVMQPPHDNVYLSNKPIKDLDNYIDEYLFDIDNCGIDVDPTIRQKTKDYLNTWKAQLNYNV